MIGTRSRKERGQALQAVISTAKREYRARVWQEKGGKVFNNKYKRDKVPGGQLCVLYVSPEGRKFRSWKQCVRYLGEDPVESMSWKGLIPDGGSPTSSFGTDSEHRRVHQAVAWKPGSVDCVVTSPPQMEESERNGATAFAQKSQSLNVISSSSSSENNNRKSGPPPDTQGFHSKKVLPGEESTPASSSSSSSEENKSSPRSVDPNSILSLSSSEELDGLNHCEAPLTKRIIYLHSSHTTQSEKKLGHITSRIGQMSEVRYGGVMAQKSLQSLRELLNEVVKDANKDNRTLRPSDETEPARRSGDRTSAEAQHDKDAQREGKLQGTDASAAAGLDSPPEGAEGTRKCSRANDEGFEGKRKNATSETPDESEMRTDDPHSAEKARNVRSKVLRENGTDMGSRSKDDQNSTELLKERLWKLFEDAVKCKSSTKTRSPRRQNRKMKKRNTSCCPAATVVVVCPCSTHTSHRHKSNSSSDDQ